MQDLYANIVDKYADFAAHRGEWVEPRSIYGDPAFAKIPIETLLSDAYAEQRRKLPHCCRQERMTVSLIQSNYRGLGSGLVADGLGFMFHDRAELCSLDPRSPNVYVPGKRPFHTIIPAFVMKGGEPYLAFGVMGGDMQAQGQVLLNIIAQAQAIDLAPDASQKVILSWATEVTIVHYYGDACYITAILSVLSSSHG